MKIINNRWVQLLAFLLILSPATGGDISGLEVPVLIVILVITVPAIRRRVGLDRLDSLLKQKQKTGTTAAPKRHAGVEADISNTVNDAEEKKSTSMRRFFQIDVGSSGGELVIGRVSQEFYDYWCDKSSSELLAVMLSNGEKDNKSPPPNDEMGWQHWSNYADIFQVGGPYLDSVYTVTEVSLSDEVRVNEYGELEDVAGVVLDPQEFEGKIVENESSKRSYEYESSWVVEVDLVDSDDGVPIIMIHSSEKGDFGELYIATDGSGFKPELFEISSIESPLAEQITSYWYDKRQLYGYPTMETRGKDESICLGHMSEEVINYIAESSSKFEQRMLSESRSCE